MAHADKTGGMMELGEVRQKLIKSRGRSTSNEVKQFVHKIFKTGQNWFAVKKYGICK